MKDVMNRILGTVAVVAGCWLCLFVAAGCSDPAADVPDARPCSLEAPETVSTRLVEPAFDAVLAPSGRLHAVYEISSDAPRYARLDPGLEWTNEEFSLNLSYPRVALSSAGDAHIFGFAGTQLHHASVADDGTVAGALEVPNTSTSVQRALELAVAVHPNGDVYAAFIDSRADGDRVHLAQLSTGGTWETHDVWGAETSARPRDVSIQFDAVGNGFISFVADDRAYRLVRTAGTDDWNETIVYEGDGVQSAAMEVTEDGVSTMVLETRGESGSWLRLATDASGTWIVSAIAGPFFSDSPSAVTVTVSPKGEVAAAAFFDDGLHIYRAPRTDDASSWSDTLVPEAQDPTRGLARVVAELDADGNAHVFYVDGDQTLVHQRRCRDSL